MIGLFLFLVALGGFLILLVLACALVAYWFLER